MNKIQATVDRMGRLMGLSINGVPCSYAIVHHMAERYGLNLDALTQAELESAIRSSVREMVARLDEDLARLDKWARIEKSVSADSACPECARSFGPHYRGVCEH